MRRYQLRTKNFIFRILKMYDGDENLELFYI